MKKTFYRAGCIGFSIVTVLIVTVLYLALFTGGPSFGRVEKRCAEIAKSDSPSKKLESWLDDGQYLYSRTNGPFSSEEKEFLTNGYVGFSPESVEDTSYYIEFEADVRGGLLSYRVAYGYFLFSSDGGFVDFRLDCTNYGIL